MMRLLFGLGIHLLFLYLYRLCMAKDLVRQHRLFKDRPSVELRAISISLSARVSTPAPGTAEFLDCFRRRALFYCLAHIHDSIPQTIYLKQKLRGGLLDFCELQRHFASYHITSHTWFDLGCLVFLWRSFFGSFSAAGWHNGSSVFRCSTRGNVCVRPVQLDAKLGVC